MQGPSNCAGAQKHNSSKTCTERTPEQERRIVGSLMIRSEAHTANVLQDSREGNKHRSGLRSDHFTPVHTSTAADLTAASASALAQETTATCRPLILPAEVPADASCQASPSCGNIQPARVLQETERPTPCQCGDVAVRSKSSLSSERHR